MADRLTSRLCSPWVTQQSTYSADIYFQLNSKLYKWHRHLPLHQGSQTQFDSDDDIFNFNPLARQRRFSSPVAIMNKDRIKRIHAGCTTHQARPGQKEADPLPTLIWFQLFIFLLSVVRSWSQAVWRKPFLFSTDRATWRMTLSISSVLESCKLKSFH